MTPWKKRDRHRQDRGDTEKRDSQPARLLLYYCTSNYYCTTTVLLLYYCTTTDYCTTTVLLLYYYCTTTVLLLYYYCTTTVLLYYSVLLLYYYCTTTVLLYYYCTAVLLLYYCTTVLLTVLLITESPGPKQLRPRPPQTTKDDPPGGPQKMHITIAQGLVVWGWGGGGGVY